MEISIYFNPIALSLLEEIAPTNIGQWGNFIETFSEEDGFPSLEGKKLALIGIPEDRNAMFSQSAEKAADEIRQYFYQLYPSKEYEKIVDLGNMKPGNKVTDTYFSLQEIIKTLLEYDIFPIFMGGSQDLTFAIYKAFEQMKKLVNLVTIDARLDLGTADEDINESNYLSNIVTQKPNYLFNFTNLAYQSYLNDFNIINLMKEFYFDVHRLGNVRASMKDYESHLRNADILSFDISSVRASDAPGQNFSSPNGLYGEEACQLAYYAGLSEKLSVAGFFNYNPTLDIQSQTAQLIAQIIWHFVEGFTDRFYESPWQNDKKFKRYIVTLEYEFIIFYQSKESRRWWIEVPVPPARVERYGEQMLIPCTAKEYEIASRQGEIPDLYIKAMQKMQ
jgi:arginase family enzyme